jgi:hypothetical protein
METQKHAAEAKIQSSDTKITQPGLVLGWSDPRVSGWDRVKEAFHRDWEQTKADFSTTSGLQLNQNAGDTLKQAAGAGPIPAMTEKTRPPSRKDVDRAHAAMVANSKVTAKEVVVQREDAAAEQARLQQRTRDVLSDLSKHEVKASQEIADLTQQLDNTAADAHARLDASVARFGASRDEWVLVEREASYGYAARAQFPQFPEWNAELEVVLSGDWKRQVDASSWESSREGVRRGWDFFKIS